MTPGINRIKTWLLIAAMGGAFVLLGGWIGGISSIGSSAGLMLGLAFAVVFNLGAYWFSGSIAVASTRSKRVSEQEAPALYRIVRELAEADQLPMPEIYLSPMQQPNAFATGRNPQNAKVAVTQGILQLLDERELRAVLAHELSHVRNRDILVASIAATMGAAITFLARMAFWFGGDDNRSTGMLAVVAWLLAPIAAFLIQMAVSRSREFQADESGAYLSRDPDGLASALRKLDVTARRIPPPRSLSPAEAHLFVVNPLSALRGRGMSSMFSTHPSTADRIARLDAIAQQLPETRPDAR
jgi:heat shock protein HtpX